MEIRALALTGCSSPSRPGLEAHWLYTVRGVFLTLFHYWKKIFACTHCRHVVASPLSSAFGWHHSKERGLISPNVFRRIGIKMPIFQAPIGSIASPELVAAVCDASGVGHLACTWHPHGQLRDTFRELHDRIRKAFGANFVLGFPFEDRLHVALDEGVQIISFFWGDAARYLHA
jgi:hypothetical protein